MTEEQTKDIEYVKGSLILEIDNVVINSDKVKSELTREVLISIIYLKIFSAHLKEKRFDNLEEAWRFMNDIRGIIEKVFYVSNYLGTRIGSINKQ